MTGKGIVLNIDINTAVDPFLGRLAQQPEVKREDLYPFIDQYLGTQVEALALDIFCQFSATPSEVWTDSHTKYHQKIENGVAVDYTDRYGPHHTLASRFGIDPWEVWFARCRQVGLEAWMSIRMNDCHCPDKEAAFLRSDFFYTARENGWMVGEKYGYFRYCFNYAVPEVRRRMLAYISEQLMRYDVDALELDFMREIFCFDYPNQPDKVQIMNGFMREVKAIVEQACEKWGHKIKLTVRLMRDIDQNLIFGFDPETWAKEGLVDYINVAPRWNTIDDDMPIAEWKKRIPQVPISGTITELFSTDCRNLKNIDSAMGNALAAAYLCQGADGMYLYNQFMVPGDEEFITNRTAPEMIRCAGQKETAVQAHRRHVVCMQDVDTVPFGCEAYRPLPISLSEKPSEVLVNTGYVPEGKTAILKIGLKNGEADDVCVCLNGEPCAALQETQIAVFDAEPNACLRPGEKAFACRLPDRFEPQHQKIAFTAKKEGVVLTYVEIELI